MPKSQYSVILASFQMIKVRVYCYQSFWYYPYFKHRLQLELLSRREAILSLGGRPLGHHPSSSNRYHGKATSSLLRSQA